MACMAYPLCCVTYKVHYYGNNQRNELQAENPMFSIKNLDHSKGNTLLLSLIARSGRQPANGDFQAVPVLDHDSQAGQDIAHGDGASPVGEMNAQDFIGWRAKVSADKDGSRACLGLA